MSKKGGLKVVLMTGLPLSYSLIQTEIFKKGREDLPSCEGPKITQ